MDLAVLNSHLSTLGNPLTLAADDQGLPAALRDFLGGVPTGTLTIAYGSTGPQVAGGVLAVSGACLGPDPWPVDGLGAAAVSVGSVEIRCTADDQVSVTASGELVLNTAADAAGGSAGAATAVQAPVTLASQPPVTALDGSPVRPWLVTLASDVAGVAPLDVVALAHPGGIVVAEPAGLDALGRQLTLSASGFGITFFPNTGYPATLTFEVGVPGLGWTPVPGLFTLTGTGLRGTVSATGWALVVFGRFDVGGVPMELSVGLSDATLLTAVLKPTGASAFPGLAALATWLGGAATDTGTGTGTGTDSGTGTGTDPDQGLDPGVGSGPGSSPDVSPIGGDAAAVDAAIRSLTVQFDAATATLRRAEVVTELTLGALHLDVAFRYPEGAVVGGLHNGEPLVLAAVLASLDLPDAGLSATTQITEATFSAVPAFGSYSADLTVDTDLPAGPLTIKQVFVGVSRTAAGGVTGQLGGTIAFASGVAVDLLAEYVDSTTGWVFSGGIGPDAELRIGDLLADLAAAFGAAGVPEPVKQLVLTEIAVSYQTGTGAFSFSCTGTLTIADTPVTATIDIAVKALPDGTHETVFGGHLTLHDLRFDLAFGTAGTGGAGSEIFVASYSHTGAAQTISLHDLVADVSGTAAQLVPSGLDIGLSDARLLYLKPASGPPVFALGLVLSAAVDLSQLPFIGDKLPPEETLAVDGLQICYCSAALTAEQLTQLGGLLPRPPPRCPPGRWRPE
ncbi:hypothetical protein ACFQ9X_20030 [Catenulispora yoronensis]